jgi:hypothetical protein
MNLDTYIVMQPEMMDSAASGSWETTAWRVNICASQICFWITL